MFTVILKTTNTCNLDCKYCSLGKKIDGNRMSERMFYDSLEYIYLLGKKQFTIILHGGEPTLLDMQIYRKGLLGMKEKYPEVEIDVCMQTNGYVVNQAIIEFCLEFSVHVGVSIDGGEVIHNQERLTKLGELSYEVVYNNMLAYQEHGIAVSALMVVTRNALQEQVEYLHLYEKHGIPVKMNPLLNYGSTLEHEELTLREGEYAAYLIRLYEYGIAQNLSLKIDPITQFIEAILYDTELKTCTFTKSCHKNFLCIDYDGDIYPCGKFSDLKEYKLGNITERNEKILESPILQSLEERGTLKIPTKCQQCHNLKYCNCGCNAESVICKDNVPFQCRDYKVLFEYFLNEGLKLLKQQLLEYKKQRLEEI